MAIPGEVIRASVVYTVPGASRPQNIFYWQVITGDTDANVLAGVIAWATGQWATAWQATATTSCSADTVTVDVINLNGTVNRNLGSASIGTVGSLAQDTLPAANSALVIADVGLPKIRGRKFVPGLSENNVTSGLLDASYVGLFTAHLNAYVAAITTAGSGQLLAGTPSKVISAFRLFQGSGVVSDVPAYQRRRKPGVGS